jgi:hypothetical protein
MHPRGGKKRSVKPRPAQGSGLPVVLCFLPPPSHLVHPHAFMPFLAGRKPYIPGRQGRQARFFAARGVAWTPMSIAHPASMSRGQLYLPR